MIVTVCIDEAKARAC